MMNKVHVLVVIALWLLLNASCSTKYQAEDYSVHFKGIKWGERIQDLDQFEIVKRIDASSFVAVRRNENLSLGEARLEEVTYYFRNNSLQRVQGVIPGYGGLLSVKRLMTEEYGPPVLNDTTMNRYIWKLGNELSFFMSYYKSSDRALVHFNFGHSVPYTGDD
ncbi:MAG: hypothetical protein JXL84_17420 [Deltaproteobacteria bacterium]|nr:hypothetical protein [Deltaproteobacteria bacterium]